MAYGNIAGSYQGALNLGRVNAWDSNNKMFITPHARGSYAKNFNVFSPNNSLVFNAHIKSFDLQDFTMSMEKIFRADQWAIATGKMETVMFSITFRDSEQGSYFNEFRKFLQGSYGYYPDECAVDFIYSYEPSWEGQSQKEICRLNSCLLTNVSGVCYDSESRNQITQFTTQWTAKNVY